MTWKLLVGPLIGALIGYITNYIAVKMLFRPYYPVKIGKYTLPFTPGIIPKEKKRLGTAIGTAVTTSLLTSDALEEAVLSEATCNKLEESVRAFLAKQKKNTDTIGTLLSDHMGEEALENMENAVLAYATDEISGYLKKSDLGNIVAAQVMETAQEKMKGVFAMFGGGAILQPIADEIAKGVNKYIDDHAEEFVYSFILQEVKKAESVSIGTVMGKVEQYEDKIVSFVLNGFRKLVKNYLQKILDEINMAALIEQKVDEMDIKELEKLCLSVMKKELDAIVSFGAVIGFVLGLVNILFTLI